MCTQITMVEDSRILIITYNFPPDISAGSFRMYYLVRELAKNSNLKIDIITSKPNRYYNFLSKNDHDYFNKFENVNIYKINNLFSSTSFIREVISYINFFIKVISFSRNKKYNLIFATSSRLMTAFLGACVSKLTTKIFYLDIRDIFLDTLKYSNKLFYYILYPIFNFMEKFSIKNSSHLNIVSKGFEDYFINKYDIKSLSVLPNGIDDTFINYFNKNKFNTINNKNIEILYAGNIGDGQGLHKIIPNILKYSNKNIKFKIIGSGRKLNLLKKIIHKMNIKNCQFIDPIDREYLLKEYEQASILFLHLNNYEAFKKVLPSKIFEYACTGKPIVAGVNGYAKKFILKNIKNAKVFDPCDYIKAIEEIDKIDLKTIKRTEFIRNFSRNEISIKISNQIINLINE